MKTPNDIRVGSIMVRDVVTVGPDTPILEASRLMLERQFNGLPVIDDKKKVVGIITEYDLLTKGTAIHLPTFIKLFADYPAEPKTSQLVSGKLGDILAFTVKDVMNNEPLTMRDDAPLEEVVREFSAHHRVNPIPIVSASGELVGIVSRYDIIKYYAAFLERAGGVA